MNRNWWLPTFSHQRCHNTPCFSPSCTFIRKLVRALQRVPQLCSWLCSSPTPLSHAALSVRQHQAHGAVTAPRLNYRCVPWQRAPGSCSPCSPRAGTGSAGAGGGEERQLPAFPRCVHSTHGSNAHTALPHSAFPSVSTASSLL